MSSKPYRVGQWIPSDQKVIDKWLANLITEVKSKSKDKGRPRSPSACSKIIKSYHLRPRDKHVLPSDVLATVQESR
ncbi:hypothetical protein pdam_00003954 [Pocillopora damicornis]|uniref:Uncharacterized protein n=1 Tax=Pocillopora damicornis TaxID=46731 RepID=A0A3M6U634_POCDA|nr:hypothetical protein pdam_00003954 [Pocillopora damicornis]